MKDIISYDFAAHCSFNHAQCDCWLLGMMHYCTLPTADLSHVADVLWKFTLPRSKGDRAATVATVAKLWQLVLVDMTGFCPVGFAAMAETKSRFVRQDVLRKPQPSRLPLPVQPFSQGSDWRRLYQDNLAQNPPLSLLSSKGLEQFQTSLSAVFSWKVFAFGASICSCFASLCTEPLARNVRLWNLLLRFVETVFIIPFFHSSEVSLF